jgi:hypothetical protein
MPDTDVVRVGTSSHVDDGGVHTRPSIQIVVDGGVFEAVLEPGEAVRIGELLAAVGVALGG